MMRRLAAVAASMGVLLAGASAHAQTHGNFGQQGQFILGADRLFSLFAYTHISQDQFNPPPNEKVNNTYNATSMSFFSGASPVDTFYTVPRFGFDYVVVPQVTIGGELILFYTLGGSSSTSTSLNNGGTMTNSQDNPGLITFGIAPRGGYILPLSDLFSLWLRGGVSYYISSSKQTQTQGTVQVTNSTSVNQFALDLDPQFVITPVPHFALTAGLTADIPIVGGHSNETDRPGMSTSNSAWSGIMFIGVTAGLLGYF